MSQTRAGTIIPVSSADRTRVKDTAIHLLNEDKRPLLFMITGLSVLRHFSLGTLELINVVWIDSAELLSTSMMAATMMTSYSASTTSSTDIWLGISHIRGGWEDCTNDQRRYE